MRQGESWRRFVWGQRKTGTHGLYYDDIWVSQGALLAQAAGKAEAREGRSPPCAAQPLLLVVHQNNHWDHSDQILSSQNPGACKSVDWIIEINFSEEYAACSSIYHEDSFAEQTDQSRMFNVPRCVRNKNEEGYVKPLLISGWYSKRLYFPANILWGLQRLLCDKLSNFLPNFTPIGSIYRLNVGQPPFWKVFPTYQMTGEARRMRKGLSWNFLS